MNLNQTLVWKLTVLVLAVLAIGTYGWPVKVHHKAGGMDKSSLQIVKLVMADEIYPKFTCSCCGQPLSKEDPCCDIMSSMINFIDQHADSDLSEDEIMMVTAKEFGIDRLASELDRDLMLGKLAELAPADAPKMAMVEVERDLGIVSQSPGVVHTDFEFKNEGESPLVISKLSSSCGCTSAAIIYRGEEGPRFYMAGHGHENPTDWEVEIAAGDKALVRVFYDPSVHPDLVGAVTRTVSVFSNDPVEFEKKVTIMLEQVK